MTKKKTNKATKAGLVKNAILLCWGHCVVEHDEQCFSIHEAFYYDKTGKFHSYSDIPLVTGFSLDSLKRVYKRMGNAFKQPPVKAKRKKR